MRQCNTSSLFIQPVIFAICVINILFRYDIQWAKGHQRIKKMDGKRDKRANSINTYVTKRGSLNIRYAEPMDSGLYTCMGKSPVILIESGMLYY